MTEPRLTEQAEADLDELWAYIAVGNPDAADRMVDAVLEGSRKHVRFPSMGQNREDLRPELRGFAFRRILQVGRRHHRSPQNPARSTQHRQHHRTGKLTITHV